MKKRILRRIKALILPIFGTIAFFADLDSVVSLLEKCGIGTGFTKLLPQITNFGMLMAVSYLLWYHFKIRHEEKILSDATLRFVSQKALGSIRYNTSNNVVQSRSFTDDLKDYLIVQMHAEWGDKKYDKEINEKVNDYLKRIGYSDIDTKLT